MTSGKCDVELLVIKLIFKSEVQINYTNIVLE